MLFYSILIIFCGTFLLSVSAQVAPGVPPQKYQQPPQQYQQQVPQQQYQQQVPQQQYQQQVPQQQYQQQVPQQQYQQVPQQQYQQVPQQENQQVPQQQFQQVPQQVPVQQTGHGKQRGHHHHSGPQQVLNTANVAQEAQHIQEHMDVPIDTSKMTEPELQFHYFKMHDADNNNKLDGCELIKSLIHWHEQGNKDHNDEHEAKIFQDDELVNLIDPILNVDDANRDGYIDYPEFIRAQQKAAGQAKPQA